MIRERRISAGSPKFDREHCDGCHEIVSCGSLVNTKVGTGQDPDQWQALCRRCIRLRNEAAS